MSCEASPFVHVTGSSSFGATHILVIIKCHHFVMFDYVDIYLCTYTYAHISG